MATCDFCDTYFTVFLTLYLSLLAVLLTEFCEGKWCRRKKKPGAGKDAVAGLEAKDGTPPSQATKDES